MPALVAVALGILMGYACGGSIKHLAHFKLRWEWLLLPLFLLQAAARGRLLGLFGASHWALLIWALASLALVVALLRNWAIRGMILAAVGILMNLNVVLLNRAMPFASVELGPFALAASAGDAVGGTGGFYRTAAQGDLLAWFGDVIPLSWGNGVFLVSAGDVVLMVAVAVAIISGMARMSEAKTPLGRLSSDSLTPPSQA